MKNLLFEINQYQEKIIQNKKNHFLFTLDQATTQ